MPINQVNNEYEKAITTNLCMQLQKNQIAEVSTLSKVTRQSDNQQIIPTNQHLQNIAKNFLFMNFFKVQIKTGTISSSRDAYTILRVSRTKCDMYIQNLAQAILNNRINVTPEGNLQLPKGQIKELIDGLVYTHNGAFTLDLLSKDTTNPFLKLFCTSGVQIPYDPSTFNEDLKRANQLAKDTLAQRSHGRTQ